MQEFNRVNNENDKELPNSGNVPQEQISQDGHESITHRAADSPAREDCPFYSVIPHQNMALPQLPAAPIEEEIEKQEVQVDVEVEVEVSQDDWVAEPDKEQQALIDEEFQKLLSLNKELQKDNDDLYNQVEELKNSLADAEKALQWQKKRSNVTESMLNQQTQEISAAQQQIKSLFQELETAVQSVQKQESVIESYKVQLETSQQRLAQLERECALIQANYNEQSHHLLQSENACRELRTRLMRQQRQTLQFKAALEKCLETPIPGNDFPDYSSCQTNENLFTNPKPIQPWSVELDSESTVQGKDNFWEKFPISSTDIQEDNPENHSSLGNSESEAVPENRETTTEDTATPENENEVAEPTENSSSPLPELDKHLDSVIQMFFASQNSSEPSPSPEQGEQNDAENQESQESTVEPVAEQSTQSVIEDEEEPITPTTPIVENITEQTRDYWSQIPQVSPFEFIPTPVPQGSYSDSSSNKKSPSPVIYPQRPPKGRKSMSAVELPSFPSTSRNDG